MIELSVGAVRITAITESTSVLPHDVLLPNSTLEELNALTWLDERYVSADGTLTLTVQAFVIEADGLRIVVDTCNGNDKNRPTSFGHMLQTDFLERFEAAGFARDTIDYVLCTHLHVDHVGWNTRLDNGRWVPTFPAARYLIGREEYAYWSAVAPASTGDEAEIMADSIRPLFDHGQVDLVETDHVLCPSVRLISTPGHTPGHVSVAIASEGQEALLTGDFVHTPVQIGRPDWGAFVDTDPAASEATRRTRFAELADRSTLLIGTHFPAPTAGYVERDGTAFRFRY